MDKINKIYGSKLWASYIRVLYDRIFPKVKFSNEIKIKIFKIASVLFIASVILVSYITGWYQKADMLDGIWVEMHGVIIEIFLFALLLDWFFRRRQETKIHEPRAFVYAKIYSIVDDALGSLVSGYRDDGEKQYVFFSSNMEISRKYESYKYRNDKISIFDELQISEEGTGFLKERYINSAETVRDSLKELLHSYLTLIDPSVTKDVLELIELSDSTLNELLKPYQNDVAKEELEIILNSKSALVHLLFTTKKLLENEADKIETREEHSKKSQEEIDKLRKELEKFKNADWKL